MRVFGAFIIVGMSFALSLGAQEAKTPEGLKPNSNAAGLPSKAAGASSAPKRWMIHQTDFYRPHGDPDDHYDVACAYALAAKGAFDLRGIVCDHPIMRIQLRKAHYEPDIAAVAQMNYLNSMTVPMVVGSSLPFKTNRDALTTTPIGDQAAVQFILRTLEEAPVSVMINITGSARDVALAGKARPDLFARKCSALYINAGSGSPDPTKVISLEYNVKLDAEAYGALFSLSCPIYWAPCYDGKADERVSRPNATYYQFRQSEVLNHLTPPWQNYFLSMLKQDQAPQWLKQLNDPVDAGALARFGAMPRNMWSTATILHAAGLTATKDGVIALDAKSAAPAIYEFDPVEVAAKENGSVGWKPATGKTTTYKFRVTDIENYQAAMTKALRAILAPE
ncbi:MAG: hypothetical protein NTX50_14535 [Candidatus Sumerlaeota bacterium]|nr:hypothetical protein [Candidatus Sumerlaeota bacterium]